MIPGITGAHFPAVDAGGGGEIGLYQPTHPTALGL
jgi:hypothetical protein